MWPPDQCRDEVSDLERSAHKAQLSVGPNSSTQPNPQPNRTPCNQQQTFGHKEDNSGTLFHRNVIVSRLEMHQTVDSQIVQFDTNYKDNVRRVSGFGGIFPTHDSTQPTYNPFLISTIPDPTRGSTQPTDNSAKMLRLETENEAEIETIIPVSRLVAS